MDIFINDIPVRLIGSDKVSDINDYEIIINEGRNRKINPKWVVGDTLILNASPGHIEQLLQLMTETRIKHADSITIASNDIQEVKQYIKSKFRVIKSAGGIVSFDQNYLVILHRNKWCYPKGKIEDGESPREAAVREVKEETGAKAKATFKICNTWHTYLRNDKYTLKKTHWFAMKALAKTPLVPQTEESITDIKWVTLSELRVILHDSYRSIGRVTQEYHAKLAAHKE